ncbi:MAG: outer membrane porin, OprD family [Oceanospirillaceae bacterium]|nr:outer membrane porin, OprD family [Oceanospirillaceae bacterium]
MLINHTLLFTAILATVTINVQAAEVNSGFIGDSKLDLNLRTFYFNRDKIGQPDAKALSQGLRLDFTSGYVNDIIGFDASIFSSQKLVGKKGHGGTGLLQDKDGSQRSYTKIGQAFVKVKLGQYAGLKAGRMLLNTPLLNDSDSRSTPSSTQAVVAQANLSGADIYAIWSDRSSAKTNQSFEKYTDASGNDYDVKVIGGSYNFNSGLNMKLAYAEAKDVLQQSYFYLSYPFQISEKLKINVDGHLYSGKANGRALGHVSADYNSDLFNLATQVSYDNAKLTLSYQEVNGDAYQLGWGGDDDSGYSTWNSVQRLDFNRADEKSWQLRFDYNFQQAPGLSFMTRYTHGDNIKRTGQSDGSEWERNVELKYAFQEIDNLSMHWRNSTVRSTETVDTNENRLILNYNITFK